MIPPQFAAIAVLSVSLAAMTGLYLGKRDDLAQAIEQCNTAIVQAVADAEKVVREATVRAYSERLAKEAQRADREAKAREIAQAEAQAANARPAKVRTVLKEVASANACLDTDMPAAVLDSLRD